MSTCAWYVLQSKPHKENQVYAYLEAKGFQLFFPTIRVQPANPRSSKIRPYFPRYMFVYTDLEAVGISALSWIPNAIGLVHFEHEVVPVPDPVIRELKRQIAAIDTSGGIVLSGLKQGDPVQITHGPLAGYEAIFDFRLSDSDRVQVLLTMLGRYIKVQVNASMIEKQRPREKRSFRTG